MKGEFYIFLMPYGCVLRAIRVFLRPLLSPLLAGAAPQLQEERRREGFQFVADVSGQQTGGAHRLKGLLPSQQHGYSGTNS